MQRPFTPPAQTWASPFYPYGSNGEGHYIVHHGADFPNPLGTPILAGGAGNVVFAGNDVDTLLGPHSDFYGRAVVIRLDRFYAGRPVYILYGHIRRWLVHRGDRVKQGQVIAEVGEAGIAMGPHLHLEVRWGRNSYGATINPEFWLLPLRGYGTLIGRLTDPGGHAWMGARINVYRQQKGTFHYWLTIPTYLKETGIQPDPLWGENWLLTDVPEGDYLLEFQVPGGKAQRRLHVEAGSTQFVSVTLP